MKRISIFLAVCIFVLITSLPTFGQDFRNVSWGMSKEQVKQNESLDLAREQENDLVYMTSIGSIDCLLFYYFVDDHLYSAIYWVVEDHATENQYIDDYKRLKNMLTEKYGNPVIDEEIWRRSLYKNCPDDKGLAASIGDLTLLAEWETENTVIGIMLSGDNYEIGLAIMYDSKEYGVLAEEQKSQSELEKL